MNETFKTYLEIATNQAEFDRSIHNDDDTIDKLTTSIEDNQINLFEMVNGEENLLVVFINNDGYFEATHNYDTLGSLWIPRFLITINENNVHGFQRERITRPTN